MKVEKNEKLFCHFDKSLYCLKQSGRLWIRLLSEHFISEGFTQSVIEPCLFTMNDDSHVGRIIVFVDDILTASDDHLSLKGVKAILHQRSKMTNLGESVGFLELKFGGDLITLQQVGPGT